MASVILGEFELVGSYGARKTGDIWIAEEPDTAQVTARHRRCARLAAPAIRAGRDERDCDHHQSAQRGYSSRSAPPSSARPARSAG